MKKHLFLAIFLLCTLGLFAQTGIYGLAFGQNHEAAQALLEKQGFTLQSTEGITRVFSLADTLSTLTLKLFIHPETNLLVNWIAYYSLYEGIEPMLSDWLEQLHGGNYKYDEEPDCYVWYLTEDCTVTVGYDRLQKHVRIVYLDWRMIDYIVYD